jgi:hypothetical protein
VRTLASMVGEVTVVRIPVLDDSVALVKIPGVEAQDLWIEIQERHKPADEEGLFLEPRASPGC